MGRKAFIGVIEATRQVMQIYAKTSYVDVLCLQREQQNLTHEEQFDKRKRDVCTCCFVVRSQGNRF